MVGAVGACFARPYRPYRMAPGVAAPALSGYNLPMRITLFGGALSRRCYNWKKWATADA